MKDKLLTIITVVLIGVLLVLLQSCKKDDVDPIDNTHDEKEVFRNKLSQSWTVRRVTVDDIDVSGSFKEMTIMFGNDMTYSVTKPMPPLWPSNGTYEILDAGSAQNSIKRSDGETIAVTFLSDSSVVLELLYTSRSGRVNSVAGKFKFEMTR